MVFRLGVLSNILNAFLFVGSVPGRQISPGERSQFNILA